MSDTKKHRIPPLLLVRLALLAALSAVLKLAQVPVGNDFLRISFENLPLLLAGYLFGPLAGGAVGVCADKSFGIWLYFATPLPQLALRIPTYILTGTAEFIILTLLLKNKALAALLEKV